ncbi:MAG: hypothetical protein M1838_004300 [Thelocarpon superellum]|nr:MAG: hypothetical protein M1838_004300 [Thelocarpon superellum]
MTEYERAILGHYHLATPFPVEWPAEKDQSDGSDEEGPSTAKKDDKTALRNRRKSRYAVLERANPSKARSADPQRDRPDSSPPRDETDPLGSNESVVRALRRRGIPVEDDARLRNQFLLSSKTFSPALFLSEVHSDASTQSLLQGLDFLSHAIDQKSASLKSLVEANFERFVKAKATIDDVYTEMRNEGGLRDQGKPPGHSPRTSRTSVHFRNTSGGGAPGSPRRSLQKTGSSAGTGTANATGTTDRRKNALTRESDYGVQGIKLPLAEVVDRADEVWGPMLGGREREDSLKAVIGSVERYRGIFEAGATIADCIKRKEYETVVKEYERARRYAQEARDIADTAQQTHIALTVPQVHCIVVTARMWADVDGQVDALKRDLWRRLVEPPSHVARAAADGSAPSTERHLEIIGLLLQLGTRENPIWVWLLRRYDDLKKRITSTCEQFRAETEFVRRHLASEDPPGARVLAAHLHQLDRPESADQPTPSDMVSVIELWERVHSSLRLLLASRGSLLSEVVDFWQTAQTFIDGRAQRGLPIGFDGESREHHQLSGDGVHELRRGAAELVGLVRDNVLAFFADPPVDDLSVLFSPLVPGPGTPTLSPSPMLSPRGFNDARLRLDAGNPPPPSSRRGQAWEQFAFWPPHSNAVSGVHYCDKLLVLVATAASEMAALTSLAPAGNTLEQARMFVGGTRDRCVQAICAVWNQDAEICKAMEDWTRSTERKDASHFPAHFFSFESSVVTGLQKVLYLSDAMGTPGAAEIVQQPAAKLLHLVRGQFVTSLYKAFSGMVENAERPMKVDQEAWASERHGVAHPGTHVAPTDLTAQTVNAQDASVRRLLTLSNLQVLKSDVVPQLVAQFENAFSVKLTDESRTIRDVLGQIDTRLFQAYTTPQVEKLKHLIRTGILAPSWAPKSGRPSEVRGYIYAALLDLVMVHTQVSTTAASLAPQILSYLLEQTSLALLQAFKQRPKYTLAALMQATLDVEFVAQTLGQYTTEKASELQSQIYLEIDRGTDNEARRMLQNELPEMRTILKHLRERSKAEFACFKRQRTPRERAERQHSEQSQSR